MPKTFTGSGVESFFISSRQPSGTEFNLKKTVLAVFELGGLELGQTGPNMGPRLTALAFCHTFEQERQDTDFHMGLDAACSQ